MKTMTNNEGESFKDQDFTAFKFEFRDFDVCTFRNCNFSNCDFSQFRFTDCEFIECNLSNVKIHKTSLRTTSFSACKMMGVYFDECNTIGLSFKFQSCNLSYSSFINLPMKKSVFLDCILHQVDFSNADMPNSSFEKSDLKNALFFNTNLEGCNLTLAHSFNIDPTKNRIRGAKFSYENVKGLLTVFGIEITAA